MLYSTFDVTAAVKSSRNFVLAALVGAGKYSMAVSHSNTIDNTSVFALRTELTLTYSNGSVTTLATDGEWDVCTTTPIVTEHLYHGEVYDARLELPGWDKPGFTPNPANWSKAVVIDHPPYENPPSFVMPALTLENDGGSTDPYL